MGVSDGGSTDLSDTKDTGRQEKTPEATPMELRHNQVGANATAETPNAAEDGEEHHMPQLAFLDEDWRGTVVIVIPKRSGLHPVSW